jgi:hypothetical protein
MDLAKTPHHPSRSRPLHTSVKIANNLGRFIAFERFLAKPKVVWRFLNSWGQLFDIGASREAKQGHKAELRMR